MLDKFLPTSAINLTLYSAQTSHKIQDFHKMPLPYC